MCLVWRYPLAHYALTLASSLRMGPLGGLVAALRLQKGSCAMRNAVRAVELVLGCPDLISHNRGGITTHTRDDNARRHIRESTQRVRKKIRSRAMRYEAATAVVCLKEKHHLAARSRTRSQGKTAHTKHHTDGSRQKAGSRGPLCGTGSSKSHHSTGP